LEVVRLLAAASEAAFTVHCSLVWAFFSALDLIVEERSEPVHLRLRLAFQSFLNSLFF